MLLFYVILLFCMESLLFLLFKDLLKKTWQPQHFQNYFPFLSVLVIVAIQGIYKENLLFQ